MSKNNLIIYIVYLVSFVFIYGIFMQERTLYLNSDEIRGFYGNDIEINVYLGAQRWGLALYKSIFRGIAPLNGAFIVGCLLIASLTIQVELFDLKNKISKIVYGIIYMSMPVLGMHMQFANQVDAVALGALLTTIAAYLLIRRQGSESHFSIISILLLAFSISIYQSLLINFIAIIFASIIFRAYSFQEINIHLSFKCLFLTSGYAICIWLAISQLCISFTPKEIVSYIQNYRESVFHLQTYVDGNFIYFLSLLGHNIWKIIKLSYGPQFSIINLSIIFIISALIIRIKNKVNRTNYYLIVLALILLPTIPFIICGIMNAPLSDAALRTFTAAPIIVAILWAKVVEEYNHGQNSSSRIALIIILIYIIFSSAYHNATQLKHLKSFYYKIIRDFENIETHALQYIQKKNNTNTQHKIILFTKKLYTPFVDIRNHPHIYKLNIASEKDYEKYGNIISNMPEWPHPDSVKNVNDNILIVKYMK